MARGLSELQKSILRIAYRNHQNPPGFYTWGVWREPSDAAFNPDVFPNEVLVEYYGWEIEPIRKRTVEDINRSIHDIHNDRDYELEYNPRNSGPNALRAWPGRASNKDKTTWKHSIKNSGGCPKSSGRSWPLL